MRTDVSAFTETDAHNNLHDWNFIFSQLTKKLTYTVLQTASKSGALPKYAPTLDTLPIAQGGLGVFSPQHFFGNAKT
eukprot:7145920-Ditylum_brightwellii.AAC.1